ncbi:hypothetical protein ACP6PL_11240 [Dapis sp. BLCC M126]|uniref:hypothetical protein n=1 Tax=Dapis sp. BLCC M126 TaxID=3400189 RepID=UPI003CEA1425
MARVEPTIGKVNVGCLTSVETQIMSLILEAFAQAQGINRQHPALLVLDGARWHITHNL